MPEQSQGRGNGGVILECKRITIGIRLDIGNDPSLFPILSGDGGDEGLRGEPQLRTVVEIISLKDFHIPVRQLTDDLRPARILQHP